MNPDKLSILMQVQEKINLAYKPNFSKSAIYKKQSFYFDIPTRDSVLAVSYNVIDLKIYFYNREGNEIDPVILEMLHKVAFISNGLTYYIDASQYEIEKVVDVIIFIVSSIEKYYVNGHSNNNLLFPNLSLESKSGSFIKVITKSGEIELRESYSGLTVQFLGTGSEVVIYEGTKFKNTNFLVSANSKIKIGRSKYGINSLKIWTAKECSIQIGSDFSCWGVEIRCHEDFSSVIIGDDCMFSEEILIYPTDVHSIYDEDSFELLNISRPIVIGNHVWCGRRVVILKGVELENNIIIGINSVVNKSIQLSNAVVAGNPARVVKKKVNWDRRSPEQFRLSE